MKQGLAVAEAQRAILAATPVLASEKVASQHALGRVLAEGVESTRVLPPADCSAMDGFAVRRADCRGACADRPARLTVVYEVPAGGHEPRPLAAGEAARIFTGAPVPEGADSVVRQEDTAHRDGVVDIQVEPALREHIRDAGEDMKIGDTMLEPGQLLRPFELGLLASLGRSYVAVHQRPRVAILSGGDELVEPDGDPTGGRIVSSNSYTLAASCTEIGAEPVYLGIAEDTPEDLERLLASGLRADVLVSSAGVSVGDRDYVRAVLEKLGCRLHFWGVKMKPGFPLAFGTFPASKARGELPLVFGLPGNPVSAAVTFDQFVRPALKRMMGHRGIHRPRVRARLAHALEKKAGRMHFVRVELVHEGHEIVARSTGNQSSGVLSSLCRAQGLALFPADATAIREGEFVEVSLLDEDFLARRPS